jgi:hypothetical protein
MALENYNKCIYIFRSRQTKCIESDDSWGSYWGELGFMRLVLGENQLGIENTCAFAIPGNWTLHNKHCYEDGRNCMD